MKQGFLKSSDFEEQEKQLKLWKEGAIDLTRPPLPEESIDYDLHKPLGDCPFSKSINHNCIGAKCAWFYGNGCGCGSNGTVTTGRKCPLNPFPCSKRCMLYRKGFCAFAQGKGKS